MCIRDSFQVTGQIASAATQAADDGQLVAKVQSIAVALGNAWEDALYIALKMNQEYGNGRDLARGENVETRWAEFGRVDPLAVEERRAAIVQALSCLLYTSRRPRICVRSGLGPL